MHEHSIASIQIFHSMDRFKITLKIFSEDSVSHIEAFVSTFHQLKGYCLACGTCSCVTEKGVSLDEPVVHGKALVVFKGWNIDAVKEDL